MEDPDHANFIKRLEEGGLAFEIDTITLDSYDIRQGGGDRSPLGNLDDNGWTYTAICCEHDVDPASNPYPRWLSEARATHDTDHFVKRMANYVKGMLWASSQGKLTDGMQIVTFKHWFIQDQKIFITATFRYGELPGTNIGEVMPDGSVQVGSGL